MINKHTQRTPQFIGLLLLCAGLLTPPSSSAQVPPNADTAVAEQSDVSAHLKERVESAFIEQELVGLSVGIVRDGSVVETIHFGFEDRENGIPASDRTMYRWASISKPITAITAMQLIERGLLDPDRDVRDYVAEFPEKPHTVTAGQLLCHQGGVVHYTNGPVIRTQRDYGMVNPFEDVVLALDTFRESPLVCEPGTRYSYTTHGYLLLGAVVERAGGARYIDQVYERITQPLGLDTLQPDYEWKSIDNRAVGFRRLRNGAMRSVVSEDVSWKLAGGGYISTVRDLAGFAAAVARRDERLLTEESWNKMWTRQRTADGQETSYGLGFTIGTVQGTDLRLIGHSGSQQKTRTQMLLCPETRDAVVIMSNSEWASLGALARDLLRVVVEDSLAAAEAD